jgi:hypothetical protein
VATSHTSGGSDSSLLRLYDDPSDGQGFTSWTTVSPASGVDVFGIHHPGGTHKRYSEGFITTQAPVCSGQPTSRFHYNDWTVGITEGGSSGSPLFNNRWQLVGQLYGACYFSPPACDNPEQYNTVYGKFSYFYPLISSYLNTITPDDPYEDNDTLDQAAILEPGLRDLILVDFDDYFAVVVDGPAELIATAAFSTSQINLNLRLLTDRPPGRSRSAPPSNRASTSSTRGARAWGRGRGINSACNSSWRVSRRRRRLTRPGSSRTATWRSFPATQASTPLCGSRSTRCKFPIRPMSRGTLRRT